MHDGRLRTIDAVLRHYAEEVQLTPNLAPELIGAGRLGIPLTPEERTRLKAFLATLTDDSFIRNPAFAEQ
jgi:cytochrome c peroxidase